MQVDKHFEDKLESYDLEALDSSEDIIYGVDASMRLAFLNESWTHSARENDADDSFFDEWGLGARIDLAWPDSLAPFYRDKFEQTARSGEPWEMEYLCPAPEVARDYKMKIHPLPDGGWLVVHMKVRQRSHDFESRETDFVETYRHDDGFFRQCSHCGRFRSPEAEEEWHWVPSLFEDPPDKTSHGLCQMCFGFYYG